MLPIASGKGGVGKTNLAVNLAIAAGLRLARNNRRVLLIDGDIGMPNTDLVLGVRPGTSLADVIEKSTDDLASIVTATRYPGLDFIAGAEEASLLLGNLYYQQRRSLMNQVSRLHSSLIIFDLGASGSKEILDFFAMSASGLLVLNPEPTSLRDAYVFLKNAIIRRARLELEFDQDHKKEFDDVVTTAGADFKALGASLRRNSSPAVALAWEKTIETFRPMIVVNRAESFAEGLEASRRFTSSARDHLGIPVHYLGTVVRDETVPRAVKAQRPFRILDPNCPASKCVDAIAAHIVGREQAGLGRNFASFGRLVTARLVGRPV
jgi:flagellar biosynthesis protein FlhG